MAKNLTVTLYGIKDLKVEDKPIPEPKPGEVLLKMGCVGICGSDVHFYSKGRVADYVVESPMVIGHEASGTVEKLGPNVTTLKIGDRVAIEPGIACMQCQFCKIGRYNLCYDMKFCASPPVDGNLCQYYCHPASFCFKLPSNVSLEEGALIEPLSVGIHCCRKGGVKLGSIVLVIGAGTIGIVTCIAAKSMGASKVLAIDANENGLAMASKVGADIIHKISFQENYKDLSATVINMLGQRPTVTIDCAGNEQSIIFGLHTTDFGGVMVLVGLEALEVKVPLLQAVVIREVDVRGIYRYANDYPVALALVATGNINVKQLITHTFTIDQAVEAFETAYQRKGSPIKIMLYCNK